MTHGRVCEWKISGSENSTFGILGENNAIFNGLYRCDVSGC